MIKLRPGQIEVAQYTGGLLAVPAVPGAGKTTVLAHLAAQLISNDMPKPGKILIVTVMNSAVANFRSRIGDFLEERSLPRSKGYEVKTLHSLAMAILKEKTEFLLINNSFQILDEVRQREVINEVAASWLSSNLPRWQAPLKLDKEKNKEWFSRAVQGWQQRDLPEFFRQAISFIKSKNLDLPEAKELLSQLDPGSYLSWALEVYQEYAKRCRSGGLLDFDDLIVQALRLLRDDPGVLNRLRGRWTYIFEDEAQDTNPLQEAILHLLAGEKGNLIRVGDSNQAILGTFTAAEPEIFRSFCAKNDVHREAILISSRSSQRVIDLANHLVRWTAEAHPQPQCRSALEQQFINPAGEDDPFPNPLVNGYTLGTKVFPTQEAETSEISRLACQQALKRPENSLAILVPTRARQQEFAASLRELGAQFEEVGTITEEQSRTILDVKLVVDYLAQPHRRELFLPALIGVLLRGVSQDEAASVNDLFQRYRLEEILYPIGGGFPWFKLPDELLDQELYSRFVLAVERIRTWLNASVILPPEELVLFLAEDLELTGEQAEIANNLALQVKQRVSDNPGWKLIDIARDLPRIENSLRNFARLIYEQKGFTPKPGVITLLTTHKSKGLEWDTVYLTGVTVGEYPATLNDKFRSELWYLQPDLANPMALLKAQLKYDRETVNDPTAEAKLAEISERLRLLYVAITRAKKNLLISAFNTGAFNKKQGPSLVLKALTRFMEEEAKKYGSPKT